MTEPTHQRTCPSCGKTFQANCPESVCENFYCSVECADGHPLSGLAKAQVNLPPEFQKVIDEKFWEVMGY